MPANPVIKSGHTTFINPVDRPGLLFLSPKVSVTDICVETIITFDDKRKKKQ